jgi:transposase-like protein
MKRNITKEWGIQSEFFEQGDSGKTSLMGILRRGAEMLLKTAIEAEITEHLGRSRYEHTGSSVPVKGYRNGYRKARVDTPTGAIFYDKQRLAGDPEFKSKIHRPYLRRPKEFDQSIAEMYVSGVSTRKVKRALEAVAGEKLRMSRSTVSRVTESLRKEFREWKNRDLSSFKAAYVFVDAIRIGMRFERSRKQAVLVAYATLEDGSFETLSIGLGNEESSEVWEQFIADLKLRGLKDPILVISDGNPGVIGAIERYFPTSYRQRCTKHKVENIMDVIPKEKHAEVRPKLSRIFYGSTSLEQAKGAIDSFIREYRKIYPTAVSRFKNDLDQALTFYLFPSAHWKRIRTSNKLERMNLEIRRRLNVIGRHPSEEGCLALVYQTSKRHAKRQKTFSNGDLVIKLWERLRKQKLEMITQLELQLAESVA